MKYYGKFNILYNNLNESRFNKKDKNENKITVNMYLRVIWVSKIFDSILDYADAVGIWNPDMLIIFNFAHPDSRCQRRQHNPRSNQQILNVLICVSNHMTLTILID